MQEETYYICAECRYTFISNSNLDRCPDCGKQKVRLALPEEIEAYIRIKEEIEKE